MPEFKSKYGISQKVYLITDTEQLQRMVVKVSFAGNNIFYTLVCGTAESEHYEYEISDEADLIKKLN